MKEKLAMNASGEYFQTTLTLRCWKAQNRRKQGGWAQLLTKYQTRIKSTLAGATIGLMFLTGIWMFLVQLAEYVK
jgi:hypothetical protein